MPVTTYLEYYYPLTVICDSVNQTKTSFIGFVDLFAPGRVRGRPDLRRDTATADIRRGSGIDAQR